MNPWPICKKTESKKRNQKKQNQKNALKLFLQSRRPLLAMHSHRPLIAMWFRRAGHYKENIFIYLFLFWVKDLSRLINNQNEYY